MTSCPDKPQVRYQTAHEADAGQRIDNYLIKTFKGLSKSLIYRMLRKGEVRVNKGRVKPTYRLQLDDVIRIPPYQNQQNSGEIIVPNDLAQQLRQAVLFENESLLIINKPSGLAVHGGSGVSCGLVEALREIRTELNFLELAHRLDRATSGCVLLAKKRQVLVELHAMLRAHDIRKTYHALVDGVWPKSLRKVEHPLERYNDSTGQHKVRVSSQGKTALTTFQLLESLPHASLIEAHPHTGRTHQIRLHAAISEHAIIGDERYQTKGRQTFFAQHAGIKRLCLHAYRLSFRFQTEQITAIAPYDKAFTNALSALKGQA